MFILLGCLGVFFFLMIYLKFFAVFFAISAASPAPVDTAAVSAVFVAAFPAAFAVSAETEGEAISAAFSPPATVLWERIAARLSLDFDAISPFPPWLPISFLSTGSFHVFDLYFLSFEKIFEKERKQFHKLTSFQFLLDIFLINQRNVLLLHHL